MRRQTEAAERYVAANGLTLDSSLTFRDLGVSAYKGRHRQEGTALAAFLAAVQSGKVKRGSYLLIESLDRLSRETADTALGHLLAILGAGIVVVTLMDGQVYKQGDPIRLFGALAVMMRANEESETKSARVKASWAARRKAAGKDVVIRGQKVPYWVRVNERTRVPSVDPSKGKVALRVVREYIGGTPLREIVRELNRDEIPSPQERTWSRTQVSRMLRSLATKDGPSPLDRGDKARLRNALARRRHEGRPRVDGDANILRGLGRCAYCRQPLAYSRAPKRVGGKVKVYEYLRCTTNSERPGACDGPGHVRYEAVAQAVIDLALRVADEVPSVSKKAADEFRRAVKDRDAALAKADKLRVALEAAPSKPGTEALRDAWLAYQEAEQRADEAFSRARPGYADTDREAIKGAASDADMNRALRAILDRVDVRASRNGEPSSVVFQYVGGGRAEALFHAVASRRGSVAPRPRAG